MKKKKFSFGFGFADSLFKSRSLRHSKKLDLKGASLWHEGISLGSPISKRRLGETIETGFSPARLVPLYLLVSLVFILLVARLFVLQVIEGSIFLSQAQGNGVRIKTIHAPRGVIYDRKGEVLARNRPAFRVAWDLGRTKKEDRDKVKNQLKEILKVEEKELEDKIASFDESVSEGVQPEATTIKNNVDRDTILAIESKEKDLPGVVTEASPVREYPYGEIVSHILGFTGEVSIEELSSEAFSSYKGGDMVGKDGLEKEFESKLAGQSGSELLKVDSLGARLGTVYSQTPIAGGDLVLSIDIDLQKRAFEALRASIEKHNSPGGSVVISDPETGEILALVSYPTFDNNLFAKGISRSDFAKLNEDLRTPLLNRAISAAYPPGSTFKIVTSAAALESDKIQPDTKLEDSGFVTLGTITFKNWLFDQYGRKEGSVDVVKALQRSNDTYFYLVGQMIGEKRIQDFAYNFGMGQTLGINLPGEITGLIPTDSWKRKVRGEPWYPGNTVNMSIGQGDLQITPLQINAMDEVIANGGKLLKPTLLKNDQVTVIRENFISIENLAAIKEGLIKVMQPGGTAWPFATFSVPTAGKTGTAETGTPKPHGWHTSFTPIENPELNVTVMLENAGEGSNVASPVAKEILTWWFLEKHGKDIKEASFSGEKLTD